jgi:hypothetical protein
MLSEFREKVWPLLESLDNSLPTQIREENITLADEENLKTAYDWAVKYYESEDKRSSSVEAKSTIFIGAVGFLITILLTITKDLLTTSGFQGLVSVMAFSIIIIYLCRVVWFAIKALERNNYHRMGYNDFAIEYDNYRKRLIITLINYTKKNAEIINRKVEYMTMAQEYFKRAIWAIAIYSVLLIIFVLYKNKNYIINVFSSVTLLSYVLIVMFIIILCILIFNLPQKNNPKILQNINKIDDVSTSFWSKIGSCFIFIIAVFVFYIAMSMYILNVMEFFLNQDAELLKLLGFFAILGISFTAAIVLYKYSKDKILELIEYFKLWADFAAVLIPVVVMYKTYYIPGADQAVHSNSLMIMLLSNEGLLGIPFVILLIRFIITFNRLKRKETEKCQNQNNE